MSEITKRIRTEPKCDGVEALGSNFESRLLAMEKKMDFLVTTCSTILSTCEKLISKEKDEHECCASFLFQKILHIDDYVRSLHKTWDSEVGNESDGNCNPVLLVPSGKVNSDENFDSNVHVVALNSEEDIPEGSWLGDFTNPTARVRVNISPEHLMHINSHCSTPEKMALTLLDCLFSREVLAISNLSGKGKHSKRQLDPLLIYGIRCHLVYKFNISDKVWHRIKQNIDSKCRAAWKKKMTGMPLDPGIYKPHQPFPDAILSEESSDGVTSMNSSSVKILRRGSKNSTLISLEKQSSKTFVDDELKEYINGHAGLFSVVDSECFTLADPSLVSADGSCHTQAIILDEDNPDRELDDV